MLTMTHCPACHAVMNPAWTACFVCGTPESAQPQEQAVAEAKGTGLALSQAYRKYWNTPETEPIEIFQAIHREIDRLEQLVGISAAWRILEEAAEAWHRETGIRPSCSLPGDPHFEGKNAVIRIEPFRETEGQSD